MNTQTLASAPAASPTTQPWTSTPPARIPLRRIVAVVQAAAKSGSLV